MSDEAISWLVGDGLRIVAVLTMAVVLRWLLVRAIDGVVERMRDRTDTRGRTGRMLREATGLDPLRRQQRAQTMGSVLRSVATVVIWTVAVMTVMALLGLPLGPLLASAGVGGVALGFGAQSLVKDFLSGIFMILEDQYGVGDVIDTGEAIGTVEEVTLRVTRLRDADGVIWYIRNGEVIRIGNRSQGWSTSIVDISVSSSESVDRVGALLTEICEHLRDTSPWDQRVLETPSMVGVESVAAGSMTLRIIAKCAPNENFSVSRELRQRAKDSFDAHGVRLPAYPPYPGAPGAPGTGGATAR